MTSSTKKTVLGSLVSPLSCFEVSLLLGASRACARATSRSAAEGPITRLTVTDSASRLRLFFCPSAYFPLCPCLAPEDRRGSAKTNAQEEEGEEQESWRESSAVAKERAVFRLRISLPKVAIHSEGWWKKFSSPHIRPRFSSWPSPVRPYNPGNARIGYLRTYAFHLSTYIQRSDYICICISLCASRDARRYIDTNICIYIPRGLDGKSRQMSSSLGSRIRVHVFQRMWLCFLWDCICVGRRRACSTPPDLCAFSSEVLLVISLVCFFLSIPACLLGFQESH